MRDKVVRIFWYPPMAIHEAIASSLASGKGLYYITISFKGYEKSLYLGQSGVSIRNRLLSHRYWTKLYSGKIRVRIGKVIYPRYLTAEVIDHAESAIIYNHGTLFRENTSKIYSYSYSELFRIENIGDIYKLSPVIRMHNQ
ncbi:hypothetical protein [Proteiniclasticum sp.]|uniref:hypothetical protein n=1 Tax=Proteiniclasticum sp. TaxID=2053595 RepID=UPI00289D3EE8|nr:hypothetical protein [Proteiniclasticum sp.]